MALGLEFNIELELELVFELELEGCDVVLGLEDKDVTVAAVITVFLTELLSDNFEYVSLILLFKVDTDDMDDEGTSDVVNLEDNTDDVDRDNKEEGAVEEEEQEEEEGAEEEDNEELLFSPIRAGLFIKVIFFPSKSGIFCNKLEVLEAVPEAL